MSKRKKPAAQKSPPPSEAPHSEVEETVVAPPPAEPVEIAAEQAPASAVSEDRAAKPKRGRAPRKKAAPEVEVPAPAPESEPPMSEAPETLPLDAETAESMLSEPPPAPPPPVEDVDLAGPSSEEELDALPTVNLAGDTLPGRDDLDEPTVALAGEDLDPSAIARAQDENLRGALEALVFASDVPIKTAELAKYAGAQLKQVRDALDDLQREYHRRGIQLDEIAGGWVFRTSARFAPFVRDLTKQKPIRLSRAQVETLAIIAYRQPITRPEVDDVRGVDSGPVLKVLLERDLVRILGKRDEVGRPIIYGTTNTFLEFFGLKSLKDLPTLHEFTELTEESREHYETEMGEPPNAAPPIPEPGHEEAAEARRGRNDTDEPEEPMDVTRAEVEIEPLIDEDEQGEQDAETVLAASDAEDEEKDDDDDDDDDEDDDDEDEDEDDDDEDDDDEDEDEDDDDDEDDDEDDDDDEEEEEEEK